MKTKILSVLMVVVILAGYMNLTSCSGCQKTKQDQPAMDNKKDSMDQARVEQLKKIFFNIPSPVEMASLIKKEGFSYDKKILNKVENVDSYVGEAKQAINLGIYGADLSYASIFDQKQECMKYFAAAKKLASAMSIDGGINDSIVAKLAEQQENRDSILKIVTGAYADLNGYLKENNRVEVSALVISGGWLEALYLSLTYAEKSNGTAIKARVAEQKMVLENLLNYYSSFADRPVLNDMKNDLLAIQKVLNQVEITAQKTTVTKADDGMMVIGNGGKANMKDDTMKALVEVVKQIRTKYIS
jgi:hypothetical protein